MTTFKLGEGRACVLCRLRCLWPLYLLMLMPQASFLRSACASPEHVLGLASPTLVEWSKCVSDRSARPQERLG